MVAEWQGLWSLHLRRRYTPAYFHSRFARGQALCLMCPSKKVRLESSLAKDRSDSLSVSSLFSSLTLTTLVPGRTSTVAFVSFSVERPRYVFSEIRAFHLTLLSLSPRRAEPRNGFRRIHKLAPFPGLKFLTKRTKSSRSDPGRRR